MTFQIAALPYAPFEALFKLSDDALAARGARRVIADMSPGLPCRVSLREADIGDEVILTNYRHLDVNSPYAATHAIYVRRDVDRAQLAPGEVPEVLSTRLLAVRGIGADGYMQDAEIVDGTEVSAALHTMFADPRIVFIDIHNAKRGCFAARAVRAD